jgi:hypothetical protein
MDRAAMSVCPNTQITLPECCCSACLTAQIQEFRPSLLEADPQGEIRASRTNDPTARGGVSTATVAPRSNRRASL